MKSTDYVISQDLCKVEQALKLIESCGFSNSKIGAKRLTAIKKLINLKVEIRQRIDIEY